MSKDIEWWSTFFSGLALETVHCMFSEEETRANAGYLQQALRLTAGARVADVPCGSGRIALELAARGFRVTGVDLTGALIEEARRAASERHLEIQFEQRDMRDLPWPGEFDGLFCFGNSFAYMDDAGNQEFLRAVHRALKPGGRFALETGLAAESLVANYPISKRGWYQFGEVLMLREASYDARRGQSHTDYTFIRDGKSEKKRATYYIYMYRDLLSMVERAGFGEVEGVGSMTGDRYELGSRILYLTATKLK